MPDGVGMRLHGDCSSRPPWLWGGASAGSLDGSPPGRTVHEGTGEVVRSPEAVAAAERALASKYGWQFHAIRIFEGLKGRLGRGERQEPVAIHLSLHQD